MTRDDRRHEIAARIADGSGVDWATTEASVAEGDSVERGVLDQLKAIAALAAFHRAPAPTVSDDPSLAGKRWGALTLIAAIGEGRFGQVYRAWDARLQRQVALKILRAASPSTAASPTHAIEEARLLARVRHPNVLAVYGAECIDEQVGIWTEFIEGRTLESYLTERGPLPAADVVAIGLDLCQALGAVHDAGLLHRDVKAQNVMRETGGRIVLMDFGTGQDLERRPARKGDLSGTPLYLAPELFDGAPPSVRSDLYALAVLLFYLSTGRHPVPGRTLDDVRTGHREGRPARSLDAQPDLPALSAAIDRGLAADPAARYDSAPEFAAALTRAQAEPGHARLTIATGGTTRHMLRAVAVGLFLALVGAMGWRVESHSRRVGEGAGVAALGAPPGAAPSVGSAAGPARPGVESAPALTAAVPAPGTRAALPPRPAATEIPSSALVKITFPPSPARLGFPSHDGRFIPYIDVDGNVQVFEVSTGRSRRLTQADPSSGKAIGSLMSPTGDRVAYGWSLPDQSYELRVLNADGTSPHVLIARETAYVPVADDWSRDGRLILCWFRQKNGSADLVLVPVNGDPPRLLQTFANSPRASLSPDGRFVVTHRGMKGPHYGDLLAIGTDGSEPRVLLRNVNDDKDAMWTPDGSHVFFLRHSPDVPDASDGWVVPVVDGTVHGEPTLVARNLGRIPDGGPVVSLTDDGRLYRIMPTLSTEVYTASIDAVGTSPPGPPTRISSAALNNHVGPAWSPDGQAIAFFSLRPASAAGAVPVKTLQILSTASGALRNLQPHLAFLGGYSPRWSPDGHSVIVWGADEAATDRYGYYRVDVHTGAASPIVVGGSVSAAGGPFSFQWSPDGRALLYVDPVRGIVTHDLATNQERILVPTESSLAVGLFAMASDGSIALVAPRGADRVLAVRLADGTLRDLLTVEAPERLVIQTWTPDSQQLLFTRGTGSGTYSLWSISSTGDAPHNLHLSLDSVVVNPVSLSPDGRQIAYTERDELEELWITRLSLDGRRASERRVPK